MDTGENSITGVVSGKRVCPVLRIDRHLPKVAVNARSENPSLSFNSAVGVWQARLRTISRLVAARFLDTRWEVQVSGRVLNRGDDRRIVPAL